MSNTKQEVEPIWYRCSPTMVLGEAPIWKDNVLHWVDCFAKPPVIHRLPTHDASSGEELIPVANTSLSTSTFENSITVMCFRKGRGSDYICAYNAGIGFVDVIDGVYGKLQVVEEIIPESERGMRRFNDGGIDAKGRFWFGEVDSKAASFGAGKVPKVLKVIGRLWRYDPDGSLHEMENGIICGNGIAWSPDNKTMYYNDSVAQITYAYDFDLESGNISNKRVFLDRREAGGEPDGMVLDMEGNLYVAVWGSSSLIVVNPSGQITREIFFPAKFMTCPTWGGKDSNILYLTSASGNEMTGETEEGDEGGNLFRVIFDGVKGMVKNEFAG